MGWAFVWVSVKGCSNWASFQRGKKLHCANGQIFGFPFSVHNLFALWVVHRLILEHNTVAEKWLPFCLEAQNFSCQIFALYENWKLAVCCPNFVKISKSLKCVYQNWRIFLLKTLFLKLNFAQVKDKTPKFYVNFMIGVAAILKILQARWKKVDLCSVSLFKRK